MVHRHIVGQSVRSIARDEGRDFKTVANVLLKSADKINEHLQRGRAAFYALTTDAIETIHKGLKGGQTDLAYKLLTDAGVVPQREIQPLPTQNPEVSQSDQYVVNFVKMIKQRAIDYDLPDDALELRPPKAALTVVEKTS